MRRPAQQQLVLPDPPEVGALIVRGAIAFARRNKFITGTYFLGLLLLIIFGGAGRSLSPKQVVEYNRIMNTIDLDAEYSATEDYWRARNAYLSTKGWFWSCDSLCQRNQARMKQSETVLNAIRQEGAARTSDAKSVAGLYSTVGMEEVQDSFWQQFHAGKRFAKRQSMWDALFMGIRTMSRGRDESWIEFALKVLMQVLLNLSMGLIMALIFFVFGLWSIVRSYQPDPLTAVLFFCGASISAASFVVTYLLAVYGAAAGGVYAVLKVGETAGRARIADQQRQQRVGEGNVRPHYD
jgi:ABC-type multidrug transport system fused ATPase/permease subunit